jgi:hypothetical protein
MHAGSHVSGSSTCSRGSAGCASVSRPSAAAACSPASGTGTPRRRTGPTSGTAMSSTAASPAFPRARSPHDVLLAGFPCQPFSLAGVSKKNSLGRAHGFLDETQGTLFFDVARILDHHRPRALMLENVKNLRSHDRVNTLQVIPVPPGAGLIHRMPGPEPASAAPSRAGPVSAKTSLASRAFGWLHPVLDDRCAR